MARNAPARVRAGLRRHPRPSDRNPRRVVPGLSGPTQRLVADLEPALGEPPGALAAAVERWRAEAYRPGVREPGPADTGCPCCDDDFGRPLIERALRSLPRPAARELRAVVRPLDEAYLARIRPDPLWNGRQAWWLGHRLPPW